MDDRRTQIVEASLALLREEGLAGFTQPRIAARVGLRQSHLTYYFPTRTDLLSAVAQHAIDVQLAAAKKIAAHAVSPQKAVAAIAAAVTSHQNTRVLSALNQAADQEPKLRALFNALCDGFLRELDTMFTALGLPSSEASLDFMHALFVGLSIINLASGRKREAARSKAVLETAFELLAMAAPDTRGARRPPRR
jgi:AcrR family transcriptional regulator